MSPRWRLFGSRSVPDRRPPRPPRSPSVPAPSRRGPLEEVGEADHAAFLSSTTVFDSPLAAKLARLWREGDRGDSRYGSPAALGHAVRYGHVVMVTDAKGYIYAISLEDDEGAERFAARYGRL